MQCNDLTTLLFLILTQMATCRFINEYQLPHISKKENEKTSKKPINTEHKVVIWSVVNQSLNENEKQIHRYTFNMPSLQTVRYGQHRLRRMSLVQMNVKDN